MIYETLLISILNVLGFAFLYCRQCKMQNLMNFIVLANKKILELDTSHNKQALDVYKAYEELYSGAYDLVFKGKNSVNTVARRYIDRAMGKNIAQTYAEDAKQATDGVK